MFLTYTYSRPVAENNKAFTGKLSVVVGELSPRTLKRLLTYYLLTRVLQRSYTRYEVRMFFRICMLFSRFSLPVEVNVIYPKPRTPTASLGGSQPIPEWRMRRRLASLWNSSSAPRGQEHTPTRTKRVSATLPKSDPSWLLPARARHGS